MSTIYCPIVQSVKAGDQRASGASKVNVGVHQSKQSALSLPLEHLNNLKLQDISFVEFAEILSDRNP